MQAEDLILVSVDDHVVEPPDMFDGRVPAKWKDRAPRVVHKDDGTDVWSFEGNEIPNVGLNAVVGRPPEEYGIEPTSFAEMRPGCYDIHERIRDMNVNGVLGSMCFPSFVQFCGQLFARTEDKELALAMLQAYNDWHIEAWCGAYPGRFIPLSHPAHLGPRAHGGRGAPGGGQGLPRRHLLGEPVQARLAELPHRPLGPVLEGVLGRGHRRVPAHRLLLAAGHHLARRPLRRAHHPAAHEHRPVPRPTCSSRRCCASSPTCASRCPRAGSAGSRTSWSGSTTSTSTTTGWTGQDFGDMLPSQVFSERIITCFIDDAFGVESRRHLELDNVCWECDYPHSDSTWPNAPEMAMKYLDGVPDAEVNKITHENAMRLFRYDPFAHRPREQCTVAALRAEATDVDTSLMARNAGPSARRPSPPTWAPSAANEAGPVARQAPTRHWRPRRRARRR